MSTTRRSWMMALCLLVAFSIVLGCSAPSRLLGGSPLATLAGELPGIVEPPAGPGAQPGGEAPSTAPGLTPGETPAQEPLVVTHQGGDFSIYSLDGALVETRPAGGLDYARPNTAQAVGESIYYVDSGGSSLGGVVRRVTSDGVETLDYTAGEAMASVTFAVSADEARIAWTHSTYEAAGVVSRLWVANLDGSDIRLAVESDVNDGIAEYFALEAVRWAGEDLVYAWQVTGIGGYILFFGWSSLYLYDPPAGTSTALVPLEGEGAGPCWYALSPDGSHAAGGCGSEGMKERELGSGREAAFPLLADQGQQGAAAYSPSGARLAYGVARGEYENESGRVLVRMSRGEDPATISTQTPGYFERVLWVDEDRMVVGYSAGEPSAVDLLHVDGTRSPIGGGRLIGLLQPAPAAPAASGEGLPDQVNRQQLRITRLTANGDIAGPGIRVVVHNPGPEDVTTSIPCGYFFQPDDAGDQRLMVVQPVSAVVPAGGEVTLTVFVVCIDSAKASPDDGATYTLGGSESGDLLKLAQCACGENLAGSLDPFEGIGLMTAGWMIGEGQSFSEMRAEAEAAEGALGDIWGEGADQMLSMFEGLSGAWFDRCGIPEP